MMMSLPNNCLIPSYVNVNTNWLYFYVLFFTHRHRGMYIHKTNDPPITYAYLCSYTAIILNWIFGLVITKPIYRL